MKYSQEVLNKLKEAYTYDDGTAECMTLEGEADKLCLEEEIAELGKESTNRFWDLYTQLWDTDVQKVE